MAKGWGAVAPFCSHASPEARAPACLNAGCLKAQILAAEVGHGEFC